MKTSMKNNYTPLKKLQPMKLALCFDKEEDKKVLMLMGLDDKHYIFSDFDNDEGVSTMWTSSLENYLFIGYIDNMDLKNVSIREEV